MTYHLAVDLGASGGRCILGWLEGETLRMEEIHRFKNEPAVRDGLLCWNTDELFRQILAGMRLCSALGKTPATVGVDTWGVDFTLLDGAGKRLGGTVAYRDSRTDGMPEAVSKLVGDSELYHRTGIQRQSFNTVYQLAALRLRQPGLLERAERLLLLPDYLHYRLSGVPVNEYTVASTTGLLDVERRTWDLELIRRLALPERLFTDAPAQPGAVLGPLTEAVAREVGYQCAVVLPASHDTGSAFLAVPAGPVPSVYVSSGTWSLLGVENTAPITTVESRRAGFTNEGGYRSSYRYLKNIMGLWMLQRIRTEHGGTLTFPELGRLAEESACSAVVDVDDSRFFAPQNMTEAVCQLCRETGQELPRTTGDTVRCVYHSLSKSYAAAIRELEGLTGRTYTAVHIVGGGSRDDYLNALTARETGLTVYAGPTEGSALGNLMVQMMTGGELTDLAEARAAVRRSFPIHTVAP